MTEIPDTSLGTALVQVNGYTYALYYVDDKQRRKSLGTVSGKAAEKARDAFFASLNAPVRRKKTAASKAAENPDRYIGYDLPFKFTFKGRVIARGKTKKEVREKRDEYFRNLNHG